MDMVYARIKGNPTILGEEILSSFKQIAGENYREEARKGGTFKICSCPGASASEIVYVRVIRYGREETPIINPNVHYLVVLLVSSDGSKDWPTLAMAQDPIWQRSVASKAVQDLGIRFRKIL